MKEQIRHSLTNIGNEIEYRLRLLCGQPAPMKRFVIVLIICTALAVASVRSVVISIYNIGKRNAEVEFLKLQQIEELKLQHQKDSIYRSNMLKYDGQQSNDRGE
jgi:hypothetical protein